MKPKSFNIINMSMILLMNFTLQAQSDLIQQKADLVEEIRRIRKEITEEKKLFENYRQQKESIIEYKTKESESLKEGIANTVGEIRTQRRNLIQVEGDILNLERQGRQINEKIRDFASEILTAIEQGIPFEREKRKSLLNALIYDIDNMSISANESFARLHNFLSQERAMSYDSQVIRTQMDIGNNKKDVSLIRIGRVFFAVDDGQGIYLWKQTKNGYTLDEKKLSSFEAREVRDAMDIIQGTKIPDLVMLPFHGDQIKKNTGSFDAKK